MNGTVCIGAAVPFIFYKVVHNYYITKGDMLLYNRESGTIKEEPIWEQNGRKLKLRYVGESFGVDSLTDGKIYDAVEENGMYRVIDDSDEDYLYSMTNPAPLDGSSNGGKWEIIEP